MKKKLLAIALCVTMLFSTVQQVVIATGDVAADTSSVVSEISENDESGTESYPESQVSTEETSTEESATESETSTEESSEAETSQESSTSETSETNTDEQTSNSGNKIESGLANLMNQLIKPLSAASLASTYALSAGTATSTDAAVYSDLTTSPAYQNYQDFRERYDSSKSIIVPGAKSTWLSSSASCDAMVTQGMCLADTSSINGKHYFLLSAYCGSTTRDAITGERTGGDHDHKSVIYVIDADNGEFVTTIQLPDYGHAGGVCYDGKYVWYSISYDDNKKTGSTTISKTVQGTSVTIPANKYKNEDGVSKLIGGFDFNSMLTDVETYRGNTAYVITATKARNPVNTGSGVTADVLAYYGNDIYVSRFVYPMNAVSNSTAEARNPGYTRICKYHHNKETDFTASQDSDGSYSIFIPCDRIQGLAFVGDYIIVSRSYIRNPNTASYISMIEFYYKDQYDSNGYNKKTGHCLVMPSMVEGVAYYNDRLYVSFESPAATYSNCESRVDRIAALDISADLAYLNSEQPEYDRVIDLGMVTTIGGATALEGDSDGYEQVMLDKDFKEPVDGKVVKYNYKTVDGETKFTQKVYMYNSAVASGEKLLVRLHDGFDLVTNVRENESTTEGDASTKTGGGDGFYVASGGTLEIRSVQSINMTGGYPNDKAGEVVIRRNRFQAQEDNTTFTAAVVTAAEGSTVKITSQNPVSGKGKHAQVVFRGGTVNYVACTDAMLNLSGGDPSASATPAISNFTIDGASFRQIQSTASNELTAITASGRFGTFNIENTNFEDVYSTKAVDGTNREGAAVFLDTGFTCPDTRLINCTFDNAFWNNHPSWNGDDRGPGLTIDNNVMFAAFRYDGGDSSDNKFHQDNNVTFDHVTFKNFTGEAAPKKGIVGFTSINSWKSGTTKYYVRQVRNLKNINMDYVTFENCTISESSDGSMKVRDGHSGTDVSETIYYGPMTINKQVENFTIQHSSFTGCIGHASGGICFSNNCNITNKAYIMGWDSTAGTGKNISFTNCTGYKNGGAIGIYGRINDMEIDNIEINGCKSTNGSAMMIYSTAVVPNLVLKWSDIKNCVSTRQALPNGNLVANKGRDFSGTIRTTGSASCKMFIQYCNIFDNQVWKDGGGIYWNAAGSKEGIDTSLSVESTNIHNNDAAGSGGGIYCESKMSIVNSNVYSNSAGNDGGGICQSVYSNPAEEFFPTETNLKLDTNVHVYSNKALYNGGGVAIIYRYSANIYGSSYTDNTTHNVVNNPNSKFTLGFQTAQDTKYENSDYNVAPTIHDNVAGEHGGGLYYGTGCPGNTNGTNDSVYSTSTAAKTAASLEELYKGENPSTDVYTYPKADGGTKVTTGITPSAEQKQAVIESYTKTVTLNAGKIYNNTACGSGGGIYVNGKNATVDVKFNEIYENVAGNQTEQTINYLITNNNDATEILSASETKEVKVFGQEDSNQKITDYFGGGICVRGIDSSCNIYGNTSIIRKNTALNRGGGVYCDKSADMTISDGGCITGNRAYSGGGVAIAIADNNVSNESAVFTITGGSIEGNDAIQNGGGLYARGEDTVNGNTVTANINGGNIRNNKSGKDGGGVWCNSPQFDRTTTVVNINGGNVTGNTAGATLYNGDTQISDTGACSFGGGGLYANCGT
ncbi:MAG: hypothetical protein ACI4XP_10860, partial [Acutalibacteraceae bacterium]